MSTEPSLPSSKFTDAEYRNLRRLALGLAVSLLILSASFGFFLLREILPLRQQINNMTEFLANHEVHTVPIMRAFNDELMGFARTNADFRLILGKYIRNTNVTATPPPAAAPAPIRSAPPPERGR